MHYPGDVDADQAHGGQEHPPGHTGPPWLPADGSDDPGYGENDPGYGADDPRAGYDAVDDGVAWPDSGSWQDSGYTGDYDSMDGGLAGLPGGPETDLYGTASGMARKGPVHGFPPLSGQGPPVYPPGQFAAWNQPLPGASDSTAPAWPGAASAEHGYGWPAASPGPRLAEPGYSVLAVADPAADATSTQTWAAVSGDHPTGGWTAPGAASGAETGDGQRGPAQAGTGPHSAAAARPADSTASAADAAGAAADAALARSGAASPAGPGPVPPSGPTRAAARGKRGRKQGGRTRLLVSAGLALVIVAAAVVVYVLRSGHHSPSPTAAAPPVSGSAAPSGAAGAVPDGAGTPSPAPSPSPSGIWGHIQTRSVDPVPLTLAELFPARFTVAGQVYTATVTKAAKHCPGAVIGSQLQSAIKAASCSQVLRASYLSGDHKIMGTIGVLNLQSARLARHAGGAAGPQEFIAQLRSKKGPTRNLTKGTGIEEADVKGHYLILIWSEFASLHKPKSAAQKAELVQFSNRLLTNTANVSLSRRLVTGKP